MDANGCSQAFPNLVEITENPPLSATFTVTDVNCGPPLSSDDGAIDATVSGGSGVYSFAWTGPNGFTATSEDISGLEAGDYILEITDDAGCVETMATQTVTEPPILTATTTQLDNTCFGEFNGSIDLTVAGGTPPFTFAWTGPNGFTATTEDISGLEAGAYSVTIGYPSGCTVPFTDIATITEPPQIQVSSVKTDISCGGSADGAIDITVSGGQAPYSFAWTGPSGFTSTQEDLSGLGPGAYSLTVTDANSCVRNFPDIETIIEPSSVVATYVSHQDVLCNGDSNGSIDIDVSGGIAPYNYEWTNSSGTPVSSIQDPVGLPADTYSLTITDANGCVFSFADLATIAEPPPLEASLSKTDVSCFGDGNGSITVSASGGAGGYEYSSDGSSYQAAATFGSLGPGLYTIWTRDANLCIVTDTISILEPTEILIQSETATYLCPGPLLGEISINGVSGGTGPYTYSINGGADFYASNLFTGLAPGSYQTVVMDATGCTLNGNLNVLTEPAPFQITSYIQDDITSCFDSPEGRIQITAIGGTGTISYSLDGAPPLSPGDFQNLTAGTYVITLVDDNACTHDTTVDILAPPVLTIDNISVTDVSICGGYTNGSLVATASGGTGLLEFSLDDVIYQPGGTFNNLPAGSYTVWVRDANGCNVSDTASINEPVPVQATVLKTDVSYGSLGTITISNTSGGTAPYDFSVNGFAGPFTSDTSYSDLTPATYHVIVRDQNGCIYEEMVQILDVLPLDVVVNVTDVSCFGADDGVIEFVPQDAEGAVQYSIDDGASFGSDPLFENLPGDSTYLLVALDAAGKLFTGSVYITEPPEILFSHIVSPAQCNAFSPTGAIGITVSGGAGGFSYLWSDGSTDEDRINLVAGIYDLLITDSNNCTRNETIVVGSEVTVSVDAGEDVSLCEGESVQLQGSGIGTPAWDPSPFLSDLNILDPVASGVDVNTTFILTITETVSPYGCYNKDTVSVSLHPLIGLAVIEDTFVIEGNSIQLSTTGGPFDMYRWEPETGLDNSSIPDPLATPLVPTRYYVFATSSYGCEEVDSVFIDVLEDIDAYNVFSPNGDGINDYFEIRNAERFPEMLVEVYSRWGDQLFSSVGYDSGSWWDGTTSNGKEVPVGTYYYILVPYPGAKPITGNVTIIR
jgi:gliding motility-associated-like protein